MAFRRAFRSVRDSLVLRNNRPPLYRFVSHAYPLAHTHSRSHSPSLTQAPTRRQRTGELPHATQLVYAKAYLKYQCSYKYNDVCIYMLSETNEVDVTSASKLKLQLSTEDGTAALKQALLDSPFLALYDVAPTVAEQKVGMLLERIASDFEEAKGDFDNDKSS